MTMAHHEIRTDKTEHQVRQFITNQVNIWNGDARGGTAITAWDTPAPDKIGSKEATLRVQLNGAPVIFRCSAQPSHRQNLYACALALESMRLNEKRGIGETIRQAYAQLTAPAQHQDPYEVLGVHSTMELDDIEAVYRSKARRLGEGHQDLKALNVAMDRIREEKRA